MAAAADLLELTARLNSNSENNNASLLLHTDWSPLFSTELTYGNTLSLYQDKGATVTGSAGTESVDPSYAGSLNLDQNSVGSDRAMASLPEATLSLGYQFIDVMYTGNEEIAVWNQTPTTSTAIDSDNRDNLCTLFIWGRRTTCCLTWWRRPRRVFNTMTLITKRQTPRI